MLSARLLARAVAALAFAGALSGCAVSTGDLLSLPGTAAAPQGAPSAAHRTTAAASPATAPRATGPAARLPRLGGAPAVTGSPITASSSAVPVATSGTTTRRGTIWGEYNPAWPGTWAAIDTVTQQVGSAPAYVMWYESWGGQWSAFDAPSVQTVLGHGATPVITWMSQNADGTAGYSLADIAAGRYDAYARSWADGLRAVGGTVILRFDHEMNGNWYPWSPGVAGSTALDYVAAWRHLHDLFVAEGATNVRWMWSPNVEFPGSATLAALYPGDAYVDLIGVDGYNWGDSPGHMWQSPSQVFTPTLAALEELSAKPLMIAEVGSSPNGGDKAAWITDFVAMVRADSRVRGFIWFDADKEQDWRIASSAQTLAAFSSAVR